MADKDSKERRKSMKKVSIIVPVYNVEKYIDQCLESICGQSYENIEIMLIYDKSEDGTLAKCQDWAQKDKRIVLIINDVRKGLGAARNLGLIMSSGEYIMYIDSDDWIGTGCIEALYRSMEQSHADYVSCIGFYEVSEPQKNMRKVTTLPAGTYDSDFEKALILLREAPAVWKKIYNKEWLLKNKLFQPELFCYEDWGYDIPLVLSAEKVVLISEIGFYYRVGNKGRLSDETIEKLCLYFKKSAAFGLEHAEKSNLIEKNRIVILKYILREYYMRKNMALSNNNENALRTLESIREDILEKRLKYRNIDTYKRHICFGSFSLRWIMQETTVFQNHMEYFGFSSLIAALTAGGQEVKVENKNEFRVSQVQNDIAGTFGQVVEELDEKTVLFIDFLEERNNILELDDEKYITESEAHIESIYQEIGIKNVIKSGSEQFKELWKKKCSILIKALERKKDLVSIVFVRSRMSLKYGDLNESVNFSGYHDLRRINQMFFEFEEFFINRCREVQIRINVFELPSQYCFTDRYFRCGLEPQYMNEALYTYLGFEIFKNYLKE